MPLRPNLIERQLIGAGLVPGILLDVGLSTFQFWAMIGAMEIGLFEEVRNDSHDEASLATKLGASERGIAILVSAMEQLGYLERRNGRLALTSAAKRSLPVDSLREMAPFFKYQTLAYSDVSRAIREAPDGGIHGWEPVQSGEVGRGYQAAMRWLASGSVDEVVKKIDLPEGARKMIDVGGSHGLYTVAFCRKYPDLQGTVLDWAIGLESARKTLDESPDVAGRIDLIERDFEKEDLPGGYDFAFLGNIIHGISPEGNKMLFGKLGRATTDRGVVGILDQFEGISGSNFARGVASLVGFNLFVFSGGRAYPYDDVVNWFREAGFADVSRKSLRQPGFSLVIARKNGAKGG